MSDWNVGNPRARHMSKEEFKQVWANRRPKIVRKVRNSLTEAYKDFNHVDINKLATLISQQYLCEYIEALEIIKDAEINKNDR